MPRMLVVSSLVFFASAALSCGRQPCESGEEAKGPRVRLDVSLGTCNAAPGAVITVQPNPQKHSIVAIDAAMSYDLNGDPLTFEWSLVPPAGSESTLADATQRDTSFIPDLMGSYRLTLTVSDGEISGTTDAVISVKNQLPVANAGLDI